MRGACPCPPAVEHLDRNAARGEPPGNAEPDHAGANDGDALLSSLLSSVR
jgi:hypothetical protein